MRIAMVAFEGFNELDTFVTFGLLGRLSHLGWIAQLASPSTQVTSVNGVTVTAQQPLEFANEADAVVFCNGIYNRAIAEDMGKKGALIDRLQLDPVRQLIGAQCSGTLLLARLGLLGDAPACTDSSTKPWLIEAGVRVLDEPFHARGPIATAGGCLASQYLATWLMCRGANEDAARQALSYAAPVGEKESYVERVLTRIRPFSAGA